uniref:Radical SAM protein n=1 Tax=candidate division WWE3 bacterium TaxID=2053526 RepID=A0A7C4XTN9_UNCKA
MSEKFEIRTGSNQKLPFADLLRKVHDIEGLEKISFISSNPFDFTDDLIQAIKLPKIDNFLHIAAQSGNDEILKKMNRRHSINDFYDLVSRIRKEKPAVEFGTDIIVGFPGESRDQFMDTVRLFETVPFNVAFISMYSPRKGTPAQRFFRDDVPLEEKKWRHSYLTEVWNKNRPVGVKVKI